MQFSPLSLRNKKNAKPFKLIHKGRSGRGIDKKRVVILVALSIYSKYSYSVIAWENENV